MLQHPIASLVEDREPLGDGRVELRARDGHVGSDRVRTGRLDVRRVEILGKVAIPVSQPQVVVDRVALVGTDAAFHQIDLGGVRHTGIGGLGAQAGQLICGRQNLARRGGRGSSTCDGDEGGAWPARGSTSPRFAMTRIVRPIAATNTTAAQTIATNRPERRRTGNVAGSRSLAIRGGGTVACIVGTTSAANTVEAWVLAAIVSACTWSVAVRAS